MRIILTQKTKDTKNLVSDRSPYSKSENEFVVVDDIKQKDQGRKKGHDRERKP